MSTFQVKLPGRFDFSFHGSFSEQSKAGLENDSYKLLILDFASVAYLDSSALGMIIMLQKKCNKSGKSLKIINAHGTADALLRLANIDQMVVIE